MRFILAALGLAASFAFARASAPDSPATPLPSVNDFFRLPQYTEMKLSPDGQRIAALIPVNGRQNLAIVQVAAKSAQPLSNFETRDVVWFEWINDKRLIFRTGTLSTSPERFRGGGLFAVDIDGTYQRLLSEGSDEYGSWRAHTRPLVLVRLLPGNTDDIVAQEVTFSPGKAPRMGTLYRVNTRNGYMENLSQGAPDSGDAERYIVDARGVARVQVVAEKASVRIHYRPGPEGRWKEIARQVRGSPGWLPVAVADDGAKLVVAAHENDDRVVLRSYDPASGTMGEVLASHPHVDLGGVVGQDDRVLGVGYEAERAAVAWFDPRLARIQRAIDGALPDAENHLGWSRDFSRVLVQSTTDRSPGSFYLFDPSGGKLEWLADRAPWIDPARMARSRAADYVARDGLKIPAYLTLPPTGPAKHLPLVVLVHGGPWVTGASWRYDPEAQFLASRGYAVLQPNFRGTTRYGWKHFKASFGQWGLAMQDDLEDGVRWAASEGIADPKRVCIMGASYGGYAVMMGLAKTPSVYRCGVNAMGVTDLDLMLDATWTDYADSDFLAYEAERLLGERAKLKAVSPVELAARIESPVLLAYGTADRRVPIQHGQRMSAALGKLGKPQVLMTFQGEGHGFRNPRNIEIYYNAVAGFLAEQLAPRP